MAKEKRYVSWENANWLPMFDWNVKFFGAHLQHVENNWEMPIDSHIGFEVNLILMGRQETMMEKNRYLLQAGDIILIPPGFKHANRCISEEGMTYFTAHFNVDDPLFRQEMIKNSKILFPSESEENGKLRKVLDDWVELARQPREYTTTDRFRLQAALFELFGILSQIVCLDQDQEQNESIPPTSVQYAKAIAEAIKASFNPYSQMEEETLENKLSIEDIVASLGISSGYGLEVFRKVFGMSPRQYLSDLKLHEAKVLIAQPDLPLKKIASLLGYSHLSHFSRQFKRWTGMSPLQYRQTKKAALY
ncbi:helix-turn-helix domain-containing protein [Paenibacillus sp. Soil787]|uniref:helix-turn-helix domain-containing protein n=1 Tax=Paenibacillus sp. Soil787 TaxID=1736411 RepID=UPI0006F4E4D0|nr:AraC family transcriptional regulator [Paenibacillus sp. Soil787]KRF42726.1 AraC family transcriptional regulator [Paenibacillus sp. Soil787]